MFIRLATGHATTTFAVNIDNNQFLLIIFRKDGNTGKEASDGTGKVSCHSLLIKAVSAKIKPKCRNSSFYLRKNIFKVAPKVTKIIGVLLQ